MEPIHKLTLAQRVANVLHQEIQLGRWQGTIPGYRSLMEKLGVGRKAIEGGLVILTARGVLLEATGGNRRRISAQSKNVATTAYRRLRILANSPHAAQLEETLEYLDLLQKKLGHEWDFEYLHTSAFQARRPDGALEKLIGQHPNCNWILIDPTRPVAKWAASRALPALCLGGDARGIELPCLTSDFTELCLRWCDHLLELGHRRICVMAIPTAPELRTKFVERISKLFRRYGAHFNPEFNAPTANPVKPTEVWTLFENIFQFTRPTALVVHSFHSYLSLLSYCNGQRIRIPEDLSVCIANDCAHLEWLQPQPAHVRWPMKEFASLTIRWLNDGVKALKSPFICIPPNLHLGATTAAVNG